MRREHPLTARWFVCCTDINSVRWIDISAALTSGKGCINPDYMQIWYSRSRFNCLSTRSPVCKGLNPYWNKDVKHSTYAICMDLCNNYATEYKYSISYKYVSPSTILFSAFQIWISDRQDFHNVRRPQFLFPAAPCSRHPTKFATYSVLLFMEREDKTGHPIEK